MTKRVAVIPMQILRASVRSSALGLFSSGGPDKLKLELRTRSLPILPLQMWAGRTIPLVLRRSRKLLCFLALLFSPVASAATLRTLDGKSVEGDYRFDSGQIVITPRHGTPVKVNLEDIIEADFKPQEPPKPPGPTGPLDRAWNMQDVGPTGTPGTAQLVDGRFCLKGAGGGIKGPGDSFYFVYQDLRGDAQLIARVADLASANREGKVGLMLRDFYNERGSRSIFLYVQPKGGVWLAYRAQTNGELETLAALPAAKLPLWLRIARVRNTVTAYTSADALTWTPIGQPIEFQRFRRDGRQAYVGLALCSRDVNALSTATFDKVSLQPASAGDDGMPRPPLVESAKPTGPILNRALLFRGGTLIGNVNIQGADEKAVRIIRPDGKPLALSTADIARLMVGPVSSQQLAKIPPNAVGVMLAKGDFFEGEFASLLNGRLRINSVLFGTRDLAAGTEALVVVLREPSMSEAPWIVKTNEGFIYMARSLKIEKDQMLVEDEAVGPLKINGANVAELKIGPSRIQSLAALKPSKIEPPPGLDIAAAYTLTAEAFQMRAGTALYFDLAGKYRHFHARPRLAEGVLPTFGFRFIVSADGKELYRSPRQTTLDDAPGISLDIAGVRSLSLRAEPDGKPAICAPVEWADGIVVK